MLHWLLALLMHWSYISFALKVQERCNSSVLAMPVGTTNIGISSIRDLPEYQFDPWSYGVPLGVPSQAPLAHNDQ